MNKPETIPQVTSTDLPPSDALSGVGVNGNERFVNRDLSWLEFNRRVLHEALDERTPLLDRVSFLAIFNSNLDEFFQKRVGGLKRRLLAGVASTSPDGLTAQEQITQIRRQVSGMLAEQAQCYVRTILPALHDHGIELLEWGQLTDAEVTFTTAYFYSHLFAALTPLAVDPGHPFPFISNLSTSLAVLLRMPEDEDALVDPTPDPDAPAPGLHFARVKVPLVLPRWVRLPDEGDAGRHRFVHVQDIIEHNLSSLFEGMKIEQVMPFRITRNADIEYDDDDADDLLELVEQELRTRKFAQVIRLEVPANPSPEITNWLTKELGLQETDVYTMPAELDYTDLKPVIALNLPDLKARAWAPVVPAPLRDSQADIFGLIRAGDILVHHPYEAFSASVERFIRAAASDPKVIAIKLTLYRTSADSPFIPEIIRAAESGKQVVCLVELKARFDEERNIQVAHQLEKAGIHVVYGIMGYKTHTKTAMVVRQESEGMRVYTHIGTGNYNSSTANLYTDLGLFTCDTRITGDLIEMFHLLTGRAIKRDFRHLLIAPTNMRRRFVEMIRREIHHADAWRERGADPDDPHRPRITAKMNSLEDKKLCELLYEASQAGVRIDLIVRGFCCLRPGVPGLSDNIKVVSIIGRFLEHSRIFHFHNAGEDEYYIGSADWMYRNLNNRVECITPIFDPKPKRKLAEVLQIMLADNRQAWDLQPDGSYVQRSPGVDEAPHATQNVLMERAWQESQRMPTV